MDRSSNEKEFNMNFCPKSNVNDFFSGLNLNNEFNNHLIPLRKNENQFFSQNTQESEATSNYKQNLMLFLQNKLKPQKNKTERASNRNFSTDEAHSIRNLHQDKTMTLKPYQTHQQNGQVKTIMPTTTRIRTAPLVLPSIEQSSNKVLQTYKHPPSLINHLKNKPSIDKKSSFKKNNSKSKIKIAKFSDFDNKRNKAESAPSYPFNKRKRDDTTLNIKPKSFKNVLQLQQYQRQPNHMTIESIKKLNEIHEKIAKNRKYKSRSCIIQKTL